MTLITIKIDENTLKSGNHALIFAEIQQYIQDNQPKAPECDHKWKLNIRPGITAYKSCTKCPVRIPL